MLRPVKFILGVIAILLGLVCLTASPAFGLFGGESLAFNVTFLFLLISIACWMLVAYLDHRLRPESDGGQPGDTLPERIVPETPGSVVMNTFLGIVATLLALILFGVVLVALLPSGLIPFHFAVLLLLMLMYAWMLSTYLHYRQGRQIEFQHLLTTAADGGAPLAPALRAYLRDRPRGAAREIWVACLLFFVVPGYYWIWHRRHSFDRKIGRVAACLEQGYSLHEALQAVPGVVPSEALLAVKIGESTGQLARCLRASSRGRLATVWVENLPALLYPVVLLLFVSAIISFWAVFLLPKMEKIYHDFGEPLPDVTRWVGRLSRAVAEYGWLVILGILGLLQLMFLLVGSSAFRWHFPGLGRLHRMNVQSRVLRMLGVLLGVGKPVPEALGLLASSDAFGTEEKDRLEAAREGVQQALLAESLRHEGLLRPAMVPLVQAAERVHNLPWALSEMGESLLNRLVRLVSKATMLIFPMSVLALGALVGFLVIGMFIPLIQLITRLSQW